LILVFNLQPSSFNLQSVAATPVSISVPTLVIAALVMIGMVWLMEVLVFGPIRTAWREREARIHEGMAAVVSQRDEAVEAREEVRRLLGEARREAQHSMDEITAEGEQMRAKQIEEATAEFQRLVGEARVQIQAEQVKAGAQLRDLVVDLALEAAAKIAGRSYDTPETRDLAASVVAREGLG